MSYVMQGHRNCVVSLGNRPLLSMRLYQAGHFPHLGAAAFYSCVKSTPVDYCGACKCRDLVRRPWSRDCRRMQFSPDIASLSDVEFVCRGLRPLVLAAYKEACGPGPLHRLAHCPSDCQHLAETCHLRLMKDYRKTALEQLQFDDEDNTKQSPEDQIKLLLDQSYTCKDDDVQKAASIVLLQIRQAAERDDAWNEVAATALLAQGRQEEASRHYSNLLESLKSLPERQVLAAARWRWPSKIPLPQTGSRSLLKKSLIGAAAGGNEATLVGLHRRGVPLDVTADFDSAACAAARAGHAHILRFLQDHGVDLFGAPQGQCTPLCEAARSGHFEATELLLEAHVNVSRPLDRTVVDAMGANGQIDILRLFLQYIPTLASTRDPSDPLLIESAIRRHHTKFVKVFVSEGSLDINQADEEGQTAFHLAMDSENMPMVRTVIELGANTQALDSSGQTALERAISRNNPVASQLCQFDSSEFSSIKQRKLDKIRQILQYLTPDYLRRLTRHNFVGDSGEQWHARNMEGQLSQIWIGEFSTEALDWYVTHVLHSPLLGLHQRIARLCWEAPANDMNVDSTEADRGKLEVAWKLAEAMIPSVLRRSCIAPAVSRLVRNASAIDLRELLERLGTTHGRFFMAGLRAKFYKEQVLIQQFIADSRLT